MTKEYLVHYGVIGMKWGVRKDRYKKGSSRKRSSTSNSNRSKKKKTQISAKEQAKIDAKRKETAKKVLIGLAAVAGISTAAYLAYKYDAVDRLANLTDLTKKSIKDAMSGALDDTTDLIIKSGTEIHRMEGKAGLDITKSNKLAYMAYKKDDVRKYMTLLKDWSGTGERYDTVYKALEDITVPSKKKVEKIFNELWEKDSTYRNQLKETLVNTYISEFKYSKKQATEIIEKEIKRDPFFAGIYSLVRKGEDSEKLQKALMNKGYSAIEDYFDKGHFTESPLVMLDTSKVTKTGEKFVTKRMELGAIGMLLIKGKL